MKDKREGIVKEFGELIEGAKERFGEEDGAVIVMVQALQLLREDGEEIEAMRRCENVALHHEALEHSSKLTVENMKLQSQVTKLREQLGEEHKRAQKCLDDADNMLIETQTERDRLKAARHKLRGASQSVCAFMARCVDRECDCPICNLRRVVDVTLTPQEDSSVCEECLPVGDIPCPKGCQPQTPGDVIMGEASRASCPECGWEGPINEAIPFGCPHCKAIAQPTKDKDYKEER